MNFVSSAVRYQQKLVKNQKIIQKAIKDKETIFMSKFIVDQTPLSILFSPTLSLEVLRGLLDDFSKELKQELFKRSRVIELLTLIVDVKTPIHSRKLAVETLSRVYNEDLVLFYSKTNETKRNSFDFLWDVLFSCLKHNHPFTVDIPSSLDCFSWALKHLIIKCSLGIFLLKYLSENKNSSSIDNLMKYAVYEDIRYLLVRIIFCNHSSKGMIYLDKSNLISKICKSILHFEETSDSIEKSRQESLCLILYAIFKPPYISFRGELIQDSLIPKLSFQGSCESQSISGIKGHQVDISVRKFTSRKLHHIIQYFIQDKERIHLLFIAALEELEYWKNQRNINTNCKPSAARLLVLKQLFYMVETIEFNEKSGKGVIGIECTAISCPTHVVKKNSLYIPSDTGKGFCSIQVELNCITGIHLFISTQSQEKSKKTKLKSRSCTCSSISLSSIPCSCSSKVTIKINDIQEVLKSNWKKYGFVINSSQGNYEFAASSNEEMEEWIEALNNALHGIYSVLEMPCYSDWETSTMDLKSLRELIIKNTLIYWKSFYSLLSKKRKGLGDHLINLLNFIYILVRFEEPEIDDCLAETSTFLFLFNLYEAHPFSSIIHNLVTKIFSYILLDESKKRRSNCPILFHILEKDLFIEKILSVHRRKHRPEYHAQFMGIVTAISNCCREADTPAKEYVRNHAENNPSWWIFSEKKEEFSDLSPNETQVVSQPLFNSSILMELMNQETLLSEKEHVEESNYVYGHLHRQTPNGSWCPIVAVLERKSMKLWYFYPSRIQEKFQIRWRWLIPSHAKKRFSYGVDEDGIAVGHYGISIKSDGTKNVFLCLTSSNAREAWLEDLEKAVEQSNDLRKQYSKPWQKDSSIHACEDCFATFALYRRRYNCRRCGKSLCSGCSRLVKSIPEYGLYKPVRHCLECYQSSGGALAEIEPSVSISSNIKFKGMKGSQSTGNLLSLGAL